MPLIKPHSSAAVYCSVIVNQCDKEEMVFLKHDPPPNINSNGAVLKTMSVCIRVRAHVLVSECINR